MKIFEIDINCDVGEGVGNEAELFPYISSCNIACGGHAGDVKTMQSVVKLAKQHNVKIGAHPSYPDKANFGREVMDISKEDLIQSIRSQLKVFENVLRAEHAHLHHIKAHGALYNRTTKDLETARIYLEAIIPYRNKAIFYAPFRSVVAKLAETEGFKVWHETFADRNYNSDLSLVSRKNQNALIEEPEKVLDHVLCMVKNGAVLAVDGRTVEIKTDTLCVHGDTPSALEILMYLSSELPKNQVNIQK